MQNVHSSLIARPDTFFGVCEGLGEDFGFHPNLLRIAFAGLFFWNPLPAIAAYAAAGVIVAFTRWLAPNPRPVAEEPAEAAVQVPAETVQEPLPIAA